MMQRRTFCIRSSASVALLFAAPWAVSAKASRRIFRDVPLPELKFETLVEHLNTTFFVHTGEGLLPVQLIRAEPKPPSAFENPRALDAEFERFSLVFASDFTQRLPQETYLVEHRRIGRFELFLVPVLSLDPTRYKYEAVFNRPAVI